MGLILVVSSPSGGGKTTIVNRVMASDARLTRSVTYTSRPPHPSETDGVDYRFISRAAFERKIRAQFFAEWARVHGHYYGSSQHALTAARAAKKDTFFVIDVDGARAIRKRVPDAVLIFIAPPSLQELKVRLRKRNREDAAMISRRLARTRYELAQIRNFAYCIFNKDIDQAVDSLAAIVAAERLRVSRQMRSIRARMRG